MRQVGADELVQIIQSALRRLTRRQVTAMAHHDPTERLRARVAAGRVVAGEMARLEVLSDTPEGPPIRYADLGDPSGAPPVQDH